MKTFIQAIALAAAAVGCTCANAELYKFHVKGSVDYNETFANVPVGTKVFGTFVYDTSAKPISLYTYEDYSVARYRFNRQHSFRLQFGDHVARTTGKHYPQITDGLPDIQLDVFSMSSGSDVTIDGVACGDKCYFGIELIAGPSNADALVSTALPSSLGLSKFDRQRVGYVITNGGQSYAMTFTVESIRSEPCLNGTDPKTACGD